MGFLGPSWVLNTYNTCPPVKINILVVIYIVYKVPLREVARGVAQERNEKHPVWNEYHYAGNSAIRIILI